MVTRPPVKKRWSYGDHKAQNGKCTPFLRDNCRLGDIPGIEDRRVSAISAT
jgi:hypothetical protein